MEEASLLVAPKPCVFRGLVSTRGQSRRRCFVAAAGSGEEDTRWDNTNNGQNNNKVLVAAASILIQPPANAAVLGDLDPATAKTVAGLAGPALSAFGFLFILRIVMSWYPRLPLSKFPYVLAYAPTEPFLAVTRKLIPPLGGVDVTPVVWFGLLSFLNEILVGPQGLLVLLSQQQL